MLKFTRDGKFLMQMGRMGKNAGSNDPDIFGRVAKIWVVPKTNEAYIGDGSSNKRVAVLDADTGKMKRQWGAYGNKPDGANEKVRVIQRDTLEELTNFGDGGRQPGQFDDVHSIATDSAGNIHTTETYAGKRLQRFVNKGVGTAKAGEQGVVWPKAKWRVK